MAQFDLKKFLAEQRNYKKARLLKETAEWGFDLTDFSPGGFEEVLNALGIPPKARKIESDFGTPMWLWSGPGINIYTGNNPITGEYAWSGKREDEKNYASYIGIDGDASKVLDAVKLIKQYATYIKGQSPGKRGYI
jgi:hypothetical protein